ncbi:hypothetical protein DFH11DRAFT_1725895 [Phellopilus nigrolimitatus]|nr:hypothetical protein DFH11DRAFT_1725895 [Phellopilus nigrolimitatus]
MSSQSPQRTRKSQQQQQLPGAAPTNVRREASPSPSLRERQRYARTQSMPVVASVHDLALADTKEPQTQTQLPPLGYPRPIARVAPPQFLSHGNEKWQMPDDLHPDGTRADRDLLQQHQTMQPAAPGTEGLAYAGGAVSATYGRMKTAAAAAAAAGAAASAGAEANVDSSGSGGRRRTSGELQTQHRASPLSYAIRKTSNASPAFQSVPSPRAAKTRTPDRSLPVQEEPDEHEQQQQQQAAPRQRASACITDTDLDHDAEGTLVDLGDDDNDDDSQVPEGDSTEGENSHTPRSPSKRQVWCPSGQQSFNSADFQHTLKKLQQPDMPSNGAPAASYPPQGQPPPIYPPPPPPFSRTESRSSYPNWIPDFYHNYPEELEFFDEAAYMQQFMPPLPPAPPPPPFLSTQHLHARPDAPIPPTPHSQTSAPTPFQHPNGVHNNNGAAVGGRPPYSPAPPGTPYPYPFSHMRRGFVYPAAPASARIASASVYDPNVVQEQFRMQMQMYAYNNGGGAGAMTDSTLSPTSTPYPGMGPGYTPFGAFLTQSRAYARARAEAEARPGDARAGEAPGSGGGEDGRITSASIRSSPSHMPVRLPLPPPLTGRGRGPKKRDRFGTLRSGGGGGLGVNGGGGHAHARKPPPRVESTQPRETSPELSSSSGEETAGEKFEMDHIDLGAREAEAQRAWTDGTAGADDRDDDGEWVEEDSEDEHELLDLEFHPSYVSNAERRRKRWDKRWEELVRAFQALDRETDATLVLVAAPAHSNTLHALASRAVRRDASLADGHAMHALRGAFGQIAASRRAARSRRTSLLERLYASSAASSSASTGAGGSPAQSEGGGEREKDLRRMLTTALHSLGALREVYDLREARWREEERRMREEREGMDFLLHQAFGAGGVGEGALGALP